MKTSVLAPPADRRLAAVKGLLLLVVKALWHSVRLPLGAILALFEPLVRVLLTLAGVLAVLTALFFAVVSPLPVRSLVAIFGFGILCALSLLLYQRVLLLLSR